MYLKIKQGINKLIIQRFQKKKSRIPITIISNNCVGGVVYSDAKVKFLSPTINLFFYANDYINFCENFISVINQPLIQKKNDAYPIGILDYNNLNIEIHFLHYKNFEEAEQCWNKRKKRIDNNNIIFVLTNSDGVNENIVNRFMNLKYPKLLITNKKMGEYKNQIVIDEDDDFFNSQFHFKGITGKRYYEKYYSYDLFEKVIQKYKE